MTPGYNTAIGDSAAENLLRGSWNIFLGNGAGRDLLEANYLLCVRIGGEETRIEMSEREAGALRDFILGEINGRRVEEVLAGVEELARAALLKHAELRARFAH